MTTVWISHNPFLVETEIIIDDIPIAETSRLYKYIKTPMQNWVGSFLPTLVEHCNDDELNITFKGLQHNYEELESELNAFLAKNRDYEIELHFDACQSQIERLEILNAIQEKMESRLLVPKLPAPADPKAQKDILNVLVLGGNGIRRGKLMESLSEDFSVSGKFCPLLFSELDLIYEAVEQSVNSDEKPILICLLDENTGNKANAKIMNMISDSYKVRSKFHKWRFIFVADNPQYAKRLLSSDFAIKNADVYASDDFGGISRHIEKYRSEVCLIQQITESTKTIVSYLSTLKATLEQQIETNQLTDDIDEMEQKALSLITSCTPEYLVDRIHFETIINDYFESLQERFLNRCLVKSPSRYFTGKQATKRIGAFTKDLPSTIRGQLNTLALTFHYKYSIRNIPIDDDQGFIAILHRFQSDSLSEHIKKSLAQERYRFPLYNRPDPEPYIAPLEDSGFFLQESDFEKSIDYDTFRIPTLFDRPKTQYILAKQNFPNETLYDRLWILLCKDFYGSDEPLTEELISGCMQTFKKEIKPFHTVFPFYLDACILQGQKEFEQENSEFMALLHNAEKTIKAQAAEMRKQAAISAKQQKHLDNIQQLLDYAESLICL